MKKFIKKIFCLHKHKKHVTRTHLIEKGKTYMFYGKECKRCGRTWRL